MLEFYSMRPIEQGESSLPARIDINANSGEAVAPTVVDDKAQGLSLPVEKTFKTNLMADRRGYPQEKTFLEDVYWEEGRWGYPRQNRRPLTPDRSFSLSCTVTTGSRLLVAHPDGNHETRIARRVKIDYETTVYQWEPEDSRRMKGLIDAEHSTEKGMSLLLGFARKTNLGGLIKVTDKRTGEEKIYEVEATFDGSFQNYHVETTLRELPEDPTKLLPYGK